MTRAHLIAGGIVAFAALIAISLTIYFLVFAQPGRESHDALVTPRTVLRLMVQLAKEQAYVSSLTPGITKYITAVPRFSSMQSRSFRVDGIHTLPYEITLLVDAPQNNAYPARLFMNTLPESEGLLSELDRPEFFYRLGFAAWEGNRFTEESAQVFTAQGEIVAAGSDGGAGTPPELDGDHWLELSAENYSGVLSAVHEALLQAEGSFMDEALHERLFETWPLIDALHVRVDLEAPDRLHASILADAAAGADMGLIQNNLGSVLEIVSAWLGDEGGISLEGKWLETGSGFNGNFVLSGWEKHLRRMLGT